MNGLLVSLKQVNAFIQNKRILENINLDIVKHGHLAIIGQSGSGKTALLNVLSRKLSITGGSIDYHLTPSDNPAEPATSHRIALIEARHHFKNSSNTTDFYYQQRYNSMDSEDAMTVEHFLASVEAQADKDHYWTLDKVVDRLRLADLYQKQLIKLSNGETKRLRIAAALVKNPELLLLDQPLTGLDVNSREYFNVLLKEIALSGITVVMAASPAEIPAITTQVVVLEDGRLTQLLSAGEASAEKFSWADAKPDFDDEEITGLLAVRQMPQFEDIIRMTNVNIRYGENHVLKNVNWTIKQGERWALLGPNGAGKSTLLSLVYGDNPQAYANDIFLFDRKRGTGESIWDIKSKCGFMSPELYQFFPLDNNCLQVIESGFYDTLGLFRASDPNKQQLAERWMKLFHIDQYKRQLLKNIPASAQRLCLLARALVKNPPLLILDEPCQGMDSLQQQFFKHVIDTICQNSNITLIYVTHYREEIPESVTKELRLEKGEVKPHANPSQGGEEL